MTEVPRLTKKEWPAHITDALGIPSIRGSEGPWHSVGDTIDVAWFHAMCDVFRIYYPGERIRAMEAIVNAAGGTWDDAAYSSRGVGKADGGNVRREAFEYLWILLHDGGWLTAEHEPAPLADSLQALGGGHLPEPRWALQRIRLRMGQPAFRARLLVAYDGRCAITQADVPETLEAAHIVSHANGGTTQTSNGPLLRADMHTSFDLRLIVVDTAKWTVLAHPDIRRSDVGREIHRAPFRLPTNFAHRPSPVDLDVPGHQVGGSRLMGGWPPSALWRR